MEIGELSLQKGDIVRAVSRRYPGWVWVNHNQTEGWYPENHLKHYDDFSEIGEKRISIILQNEIKYTDLVLIFLDGFILLNV